MNNEPGIDLEKQLAEARAELAERDRDLASALGRLEDLTDELDATNRGIIALHSELESAREAEAHAEAEREVNAERDRIARDLHDLVIRRVFGASMALQGVARLIRQPQLSSRIKSVILDLDDTIRELRAAIFELHEEPSRKAGGLRSQLVELATQAQDALGHTPTLGFQGPISGLAEGIAAVVLAITRTALANITRHADSTRTEITLAAGEELLLRIEADGGGLRQTSRTSALGNVGQRATAHGGIFRISTAPDGETRLEWRVPLPPGAQPAEGASPPESSPQMGRP
ncbi:MAG TPA: histidine kinase [Pseudonocardiaceae bacterium]